MRRFVPLVLTVFLLIPALAFAAAYDTPSCTFYAKGQAKIGLEVTAGPSGAPAGFTVVWMKHQDYLDAGSQWVNPHIASFGGIPTLNLWGAWTFQLGAADEAVVEMGDLFDETGVAATNTTELQPATAYVFRVFANGDGNGTASPHSGNIVVSTNAISNCTYTQGYWKTHPEDWPVLSLTVGGMVYNQAELLSIFNTPAAGNGLLSMAHQLIAAKLNVANGAIPGATVQAQIDAADALIVSSCGGDKIPPVGTCYIHPGTTSSHTDDLDTFNNGLAGVPHCGAVSVEQTSWGSVKAGYR
jgi:hypothetical protein